MRDKVQCGIRETIRGRNGHVYRIVARVSNLTIIYGGERDIRLAHENRIENADIGANGRTDGKYSANI